MVKTQQASFWQTHWQKMVALILWLALISAYVWYTQTNGLGPWAAARRLLDLMGGSALGPLLFISIYALRPLIFFSAAVLTLAGGFLFGPFWGIVYAMAGGNLSAILAYWIGYFFGKDILTEEESKGILHHYAQRLRRNSFETVLIMRFLFLPFDPVSYLAGFLRINWKAFMLATSIGSIPGSIAITLAGASGGFNEEGLSFDPWILLVAIIILLLSLGFSRFLRRREEVRQANDAIGS
jgi:uncharacterized membrane protein YdjX (TVP38/TMEM64 family)